MELLQQDRRMIKNNPEIISFLSKYGALITYIIIGLMGKFGFDIVSGKRISGWYIVGTGLMAVFVGWLAWEWCLSHPDWNPGFTIPIATLVSRDVLLFLMLIDWMSVLRILTGKVPAKEKIKK